VVVHNPETTCRVVGARGAALQRLNPLATFGVTHFADWTDEEIEASRNRRIAQNPHRLKNASQVTKNQLGGAPRSIDWRDKGAVTSVKDKGQSGDCWAFSAAGNIEGQWAIAGHSLVSLSAQEITACCATAWRCQGGLLSRGLSRPPWTRV
jgi:hypothetical protein